MTRPPGTGTTGRSFRAARAALAAAENGTAETKWPPLRP